MREKMKISVVAFISLIIFTGISSIVNSSLSNDYMTNPNNDAKISSNHGAYDLGGNNNMELMSSDMTTSTVLSTEESMYGIISQCNSSKEGSSHTMINDTHEIVASSDNITTLYDYENNINTSIDTDFDDPSVSMKTPTEIIDVFAYPLPGYMGHFELSNGTWLVNYDRHSSVQEFRGISPEGSVVVSRHGDEGIDEDILIGDEVHAYFNVTKEGVIYWDDGGSWVIIGDMFIGIFGAYIAPFDIAVAGLEEEFHTHTLVVEDTNDLWEVIVTWDGKFFDIMISSLTFPLQIIDPAQSDSFTIYYGSLVCTVYQDILNLYYVLIYNNLKIEYYDDTIVIIWEFISIEILLSTSIHWIVLFQWEFWFIKIQFWFELWEFWQFVDYVIWIEYEWNQYNWIYVYDAPLISLPNPLVIQVVKEILDEGDDIFTIHFTVRDYQGQLVDADTITIAWDGQDFSDELERSGIGNYSVELNAVYVDGDEGSTALDIVASKMGYADGSLHKMMEIDVDEQSIPTPATFGDMVSIIMTIVVGFLGSMLGIAVLIKKRGNKKRDAITPSI